MIYSYCHTYTAHFSKPLISLSFMLVLGNCMTSLNVYVKFKYMMFKRFGGC